MVGDSMDLMVECKNCTFSDKILIKEFLGLQPPNLGDSLEERVLRILSRINNFRDLTSFNSGLYIPPKWTLMKFLGY